MNHLRNAIGSTSSFRRRRKTSTSFRAFEISIRIREKWAFIKLMRLLLFIRHIYLRCDTALTHTASKRKSIQFENLRKFISNWRRRERKRLERVRCDISLFSKIKYCLSLTHAHLWYRISSIFQKSLHQIGSKGEKGSSENLANFSNSSELNWVQFSSQYPNFLFSILQFVRSHQTETHRTL